MKFLLSLFSLAFACSCLAQEAVSPQVVFAETYYIFSTPTIKLDERFKYADWKCPGYTLQWVSSCTLPCPMESINVYLGPTKSTISSSMHDLSINCSGIRARWLRACFPSEGKVRKFIADAPKDLYLDCYLTDWDLLDPKGVPIQLGGGYDTDSPLMKELPFKELEKDEPR